MSSPFGTSRLGSLCWDVGVSSKDVEITTVVQHGDAGSKRHCPDRTVGQSSDRLARVSAREIQAGRGFVARQSLD